MEWFRRPDGSVFTVTVPGVAPAVFSVAVFPLPEMSPLVVLHPPTVTGTLSGLVQVQETVTVPGDWTVVGFAVQERVGGFLGTSFKL